jgi:hypothetical protein
MLPVKSNTADKGCSPVSSNCVIWQGPDLSCINLCNGDAVSDVVYKLATQLCTIQSALDLSTLDLSCLVSFCASTNPAPTNKTLSAVLDFIIDKVCCLNTTIQNLPGGGGGYTEPNLTLPTCLQYNDPATGQTITQLVHNQYTLRLGNQYCTLKATVDGHTTTLATYNTRITALENSPGLTLPTVTPNCILPSTPTAMNLVVDKLEEEYCNLRSVLGTNAGLTAAVGQQCQGLATQNALSQPGYVSGLTGWVPTSGDALSGTVAGAIKNLWVVLCDMRSAIYDLKNQAGTTDCSSFLLGISAAANEARTQVTVFFSGTTVVPAGFANCNAQGSKVTIKDTSGHTYTGYVDLLAAQSDTDGITFDVTGASLSPSQNYTVTVEGCVTKNGNTCSKVATFSVPLPCPIITSVSATLQ